MSRIMQGNAHVVPPAERWQPGDEIPVDDGNRPVAPAKPQRRDVLPLAARAKLIALQGAADDAGDATNSAPRRMGELRKGLNYSENPDPNSAAIELELMRLDKVRSAQDKRHRELAD